MQFGRFPGAKKRKFVKQESSEEEERIEEEKNESLTARLTRLESGLQKVKRLMNNLGKGVKKEFLEIKMNLNALFTQCGTSYKEVNVEEEDELRKAKGKGKKVEEEPECEDQDISEEEEREGSEPPAREAGDRPARDHLDLAVTSYHGKCFFHTFCL